MDSPHCQKSAVEVLKKRCENPNTCAILWLTGIYQERIQGEGFGGWNPPPLPGVISIIGDSIHGEPIPKSYVKVRVEEINRNNTKHITLNHNIECGGSLTQPHKNLDKWTWDGWGYRIQRRQHNFQLQQRLWKSNSCGGCYPRWTYPKILFKDNGR